MEKGLFALVAAGIVGVWLFLSFSQSHDAQRSTFSAQQAVEAAKFDKEFAEAQGKKPTPEQLKELEDSKKRLADAQANQDTVDAQRRGEVSALKVETETTMRQQGVDVSKIKSQINAIGENK